MDAINPELNTDIQENAPQQEDIIIESYKGPRNEYMQEYHKLQTQIDGQKMV